MPRRNPAFAVAVLAIVAGIGASWPAVNSFLVYWKGQEMLSDSHAYVMAALAAWQIWRVRPDVEAAGLSPSWLFVALTALMSFASYLAWISAIEIASEILFPMLLLSAVAGAIGRDAARPLAFGIGFLVFALPTWGHLNVGLQYLSATGVTALARVTGLPAYVEGNTVQIPSGSLEIGGGCSGVNYLIVAVAIAVLYGELGRQQMRHRVLLVAVAAALAIAMNWVRIYGIVLNAYATDMEGYLVTVEHLRYGWVLFGLLMVTFFWLARRLVPYEGPAAAPRLAVEVDRGGGLVAIVFVLGALAISPALVMRVNDRRPDVGRAALTLPRPAGEWSGPVAGHPSWRPLYPESDAQVFGDYLHGDARITVYVNAYAYQAQGHEFIGFGKDVLGAAGWQREGPAQFVAKSGPSGVSYMSVTAAAPSRERWVVVYAYSVGGRTFTGSMSSKVYYGFAALMNRPWSGVVAAATQCNADCAAASVVLSRFMAQNGVRLADSISSLPVGT